MDSRGIGFAFGLFVLATSVVGCGGKKLVEVSGSVSVDGKPADGAALLFFPSTGEGSVATGTCTADGKYKLVCDAEVGVPAGSYIVAIRWPDPAIKPTAAQKMTGLFEEGPDLLKGAYGSKQTTSLKAEITPSTKEVPAFELKTK